MDTKLPYTAIGSEEKRGNSLALAAGATSAEAGSGEAAEN